MSDTLSYTYTLDILYHIIRFTYHTVTHIVSHRITQPLPPPPPLNYQFLLSTLGDRIAIMSEGLVRCSGTSLFLKTRYGAGYVLTLTLAKTLTGGQGDGGGGNRSRKDTNVSMTAPLAAASAVSSSLLSSSLSSATASAAASSSLSSKASQRSSRRESLSASIHASQSQALVEIQHLIHQHIPQASLTSHIASELVFSLPLSSVHLFASLFCSLQQRAEDLGVGSYGVSLTSLEQVFLRLAKETRLADDDEILDGGGVEVDGSGGMKGDSADSGIDSQVVLDNNSNNNNNNNRDASPSPYPVMIQLQELLRKRYKAPRYSTDLSYTN